MINRENCADATLADTLDRAARTREDLLIWQQLKNGCELAYLFAVESLAL
jgi:hypothetical protein